MSTSRSKFWALLIIATMCAETSSAFDKTDEQRFLNEYPPAAERFIKKLAMSAGTIESTPVGKSANEEKRTYEFRRDHGCEKIDIVADMKLSGKSRRISSAYVYCDDEKTFYSLTKRPDDDGYLVESLGTSARDFVSYRASVGKLMTVPLGSFHSLVLSLLNDNERVIDEVAPEPSDPKLMRVRFLVTQKDPQKSKSTFTFVLDPENHWAVVSEEHALEGKRPSVMKMEVEYGPKVDGFAMPAKVKFTRNQNLESEYRYLDWRFVSTSRDEFQPSHYDLPDLPLARNRRIPTFAYVVIALIVSLAVVGGYLLKVSKRSTKPA